MLATTRLPNEVPQEIQERVDSIAKRMVRCECCCAPSSIFRQGLEMKGPLDVFINNGLSGTAPCSHLLQLSPILNDFIHAGGLLIDCIYYVTI